MSRQSVPPTNQSCKELLQAEAEGTQKSIVGIMHHVDGNPDHLTALKDRLGAELLFVALRQPPANTEEFYKCCAFKIGPNDAHVFVAERGKLAELQLRFLIDEEQETVIRKADFSECVADKLNCALASFKDARTQAVQEVASKKQIFDGRVRKCEEQVAKLKEDRG